MHTRMTLVRLGNGNLWVHSPIAFSATTQDLIAKLGGDVAALVAPNKYHHLYIQDWRDAYPNAQVYAEPHVQKKVAALASANQITDVAATQYANELDQVLFRGNRLFQEAIFFHKASRTLILTDLMLNLKVERVKFLPKLFLKFEGAVYPNGGILRLFRWCTLDKAKARQALATIQAWAPDQITFCHGVPFLGDAENIINKEFRWLLS